MVTAAKELEARARRAGEPGDARALAKEVLSSFGRTIDLRDCAADLLERLIAALEARHHRAAPTDAAPSSTETASDSASK